MPVEVHSISNGLGLHFLYSGKLRHQESRHVNGKLAENPIFAQARFSIIDNLQVTEHLLSTHEIHLSAEYCRRRSQDIPNFIVAVLAGSTLSFGLGRMWEALSNDTSWAIRVFHPNETDIAQKWIREQYESLFGEPLENFDFSEVLVPKLEKLA